MSFTTIDIPHDFAGKGAMSLDNQPTQPPEELKRKFDEPSREVVAPAYNRLIGELQDSSAASSLGAVAPTGRTVTSQTVQAGLNKLSTDLATLEASAGQAIADAHTHANKALLDTYTQTDADIAQAILDDHTHSNKALLDTYTQTDANIADAVSKKHDHSNKSLLDTYTQTETDIADAVSKKHDHSNKSLLDTYTQSETDLADAVSKKHSHSNKALLDTYTQTETDIADAVSKKHAHSNKALLDTYTQTETDIADAVSKKHTHTNKTVIDKFGEDSGGNPTYDGNPIGGGGSASDTFKNIVSAGTTFVASGNNDTFKINAGSNVTITALSSPDKGISISATGGGQSTGDMLMTDYDSQGDVKTAGGIDAYVSAEIGKLDGTVSGTAGTGNTLTAFSQTDGKVSATFGAISITKSQVSDFPTIPTITDTYSGTSSDGMSGKAVKSAIDALDVTVSGTGAGKTLASLTETDGKIAATFQNISITKSQISDFPTIPTVNNATLTIQKNGSNVQTFTANQSTNATANILTGAFIKTASVANNAVTFTGINDSGTYGYDVFFNITGNSTNKSPYAKLTSISGAGTSNMSLTYETDADSGTNNARLYQYK